MTKPNFKALWLAAEQATPINPEPLYALADALEDRTPHLAHALWWMAENGRTPELYEEGVPWAWEFSWAWRESPTYYLPYFLKGLMRSGYKSFSHAVSALGKALEEVQDDVSLKRQVGSYDEGTRLCK